LAVILVSLSHTMFASARHLLSIFPLHFTIPYLIKESKNHKLQLASRPCNIWNCILTHSGLSFCQEISQCKTS
jgi:hypothetical protein